MTSGSSYDYSGRPELVRFTGEVSDVRLNPAAQVGSYGGSSRGVSRYGWMSQVGAITVRVQGKPITCLIDMRTRNIGIMPGNTVTIWGKARVWKHGSDLPESVDVMRLACEETGEIHPSGVGPMGMGSMGAVLAIPIFTFLFLFVFMIVVMGPLFSGGGSWFFIPLLVAPIVFGIIVVGILVVWAASWRKSTRSLEDYIEVGPAMKVADITAPTRKCIVCNLRVSKTDEVVYCPHCGNQAHKEHMLEWLHTHDYCPACKKHLDERDLGS